MIEDFEAFKGKLEKIKESAMRVHNFREFCIAECVEDLSRHVEGLTTLIQRQEQTDSKLTEVVENIVKKIKTIDS